MRKAIALAAASIAVMAMNAQPAEAAQASIGGYKDWVYSQGVYPSRPVVKAGKAVCAAKDSGASWRKILVAGINSGVDQDTLSTIIVGAVYELCPWHVNSFNRWVNS